MGIDLEALTPAPWQFDERIRCAAIYQGEKVNCFDELATRGTIAYLGWTIGQMDQEKREDWAFIALARNAFQIMMDRKIYPVIRCGKWAVDVATCVHVGDFDDPFSALIAAEKWYNEQAARESLPPGDPKHNDLSGGHHV
jgi:hypothetical protein